jgi:hypothetical protein
VLPRPCTRWITLFSRKLKEQTVWSLTFFRPSIANKVLGHKWVVLTVPCLRHNPRLIVACCIGSVASDKSFFSRTESTLSKAVTFSLYESPP